jgi:hypothetical protein
MNIIDHLRVHLVGDHHLKPVEELTFPEVSIIRNTNLKFTGIGKTYGSMLSVGLVLADSMTEGHIASLSETFFTFTHSLRKYAVRMPPIPLIGVKLGSFGLICFVFERETDSSLVTFIQKQKHGSPWSQDYCLSWVLDVHKDRVYHHEGFPLKMPIGKDYFKGLLYEFRVMSSSVS